MKKALKWIFIILGGLIVIIFLAAIIIPVVFKDDIKAAIDKELVASVNAEVLYDIDNFDISLFSNFPNVTVKMADLGVMNHEPFAGEILFATEKFEVEVNIMDVLFGDQLRVKGISLVRPAINIKVLEDGRANWDIAMPSEDTVQVEESGDFSFGIDHWEIIDGKVSYEDKSIPMTMDIIGLNHSGGGDFTQDVFDLRTSTVADTFSFALDGQEYLTKKKVDIQAVISISEAYSKYTFKENTARLNDFAMNFDGWFKMNESDYEMDISFGSPDNSFKSILSLVPGMFTESFGTIETSGDLAFDGKVKGVYKEDQLPAFSVNLVVKDAMFKYPDLPTPVNNINLDLHVDNKDGVMENTVVDLKRLHLDFGSNPFDAKAYIENLRNYKMDANVVAKLNLAEVSKMFPMEGLSLKGNYAIDLSAKGIYDSIKHIIPSINATMSLANGYVKSSDFPIPLENVAFQSTVKNNSGKMEETYITVKDFSMVMDGEKFGADLILQNLVDYNWDLKVKGALDLEKITKIFQLEDMTVSGKMVADIATKGKYSDVEAERYDRLPTSGSASLSAFKYTAKDLPYDITLAQAKMVFDPKKIDLQNMSGTIGKSDFNVKGSVLNYIGYVFGKETIKGEVNFSSSLLDLNEFMTDTEEASTDDTSYGVIPVPDNIDFLLKSSIKEVRLMEYKITNATGDVIVKDGIANLKGLKFNMLGGGFAMNGTYNTKDIDHPKYDFDMKIENMSIQQAATSFSIVKTYAPIAGMVKGNFSTDFKINGELKQDMMPNLGTVNGAGLIKIAQAALTESKIVAGVTSLTKLDNVNAVNLKDALLSASIDNGRLSVKPFDVAFGSYKTTVAGSTGMDGSIDYTLKMNVPAGKLGSQVQSFINQNTGSTNSTEEIPVTIGLSESFLSPKFKLIADEQKQQAQQAVTNVAKEESKKAIQNIAKGTEAEGLVKDILGGSKDEKTVGDNTDSTKTTAQPDSKKKIEEEAKKKIQNLLKR